MNQIYKDKTEHLNELTHEKLSLYEATEINSPAFYKKIGPITDADLTELKA